MTGVAVGMAEAAEERMNALLAELKDLFSCSHHDVKLPGPLVKALSGYYIEVMQVESIDDVAKMDPDEMEEAAFEAWQAAFEAALPKPHALRVRKWAGDVSHKASGGKGATTVFWLNLPLRETLLRMIAGLRPRTRLRP